MHWTNIYLLFYLDHYVPFVEVFHKVTFAHLFIKEIYSSEGFLFAKRGQKKTGAMPSPGATRKPRILLFPLVFLCIFEAP